MRKLIFILLSLVLFSPVYGQNCITFNKPSSGETVAQRRVYIEGTICEESGTLWILTKKEGDVSEWSIHGKAEVLEGSWSLNITLRRFEREATRYTIAAILVEPKINASLNDILNDVNAFDDPTISLPPYKEINTVEIVLNR